MDRSDSPRPRARGLSDSPRLWLCTPSAESRRRAAWPPPPAALPAEAPLAARLARGVCRRLADLGFETLTEFRIGKGRRADVVGLNRDGRFVIVEIKTSGADFRADAKWPDYLPWCDSYYFGVPEAFPLRLLPEAHGVIVADAYDAVILRAAAEAPMNGTRRRTQILRFGRAAAARLRAVTDGWPDGPRARLGR